MNVRTLSVPLCLACLAGCNLVGPDRQPTNQAADPFGRPAAPDPSVSSRFGRVALLVNDASPTDLLYAGFVRQFTYRMNAYAPDGIDVRDLYGSNGQCPTEAGRISLATLLQYQAVLWNFRSHGCATNGIWYEEHESPGNGTERTILSQYVAAGGKLFLFGGRYLGAIVNPSGGTGGQYPKIPPQSQTPDFSPLSFLWRFLHVRNQVVGIDPIDCSGIYPNDHQTWRDGLVACLSRNPAFPDLQLDPARWDPDRQNDQCPSSPERPYTPTGGIRDWEGAWQGSSGDPDDAYYPFIADPGLDTLYVAKCYDWQEWAPSIWNTPGNQAVVAQRYHATHADTTSGTAQGRVIAMMFQPYFFMQDQAVEAGTASIDWLMTGRDR